MYNPDDYREATHKETQDYLLGRRAFPDSIETEHGLLVKKENMNYDHTVEESDEEVHFILVHRNDGNYSVDMPLAGTDRVARVFTGLLSDCLDFIGTLDD